MAKTSIQWTDKTWNPTVGCTKVSPGCAGCYAERMARRLKAMGRPEYQDVVNDKGHWAGKVNLVPDRLEQPLHWRKPSMIFVDSMSDLLHPWIFDTGHETFVDEVFAIMAATPWHTYQILTKRAAIMRDYTSNPRREIYVRHALQGIYNTSAHNAESTPEFTWPLPNVWLGVSVENQDTADERIPLLLQTPAAVHFISAEPLLSDLQIDYFLGKLPEDEDGAPYLEHIDWVITGCESGTRRRPAKLDWFRSLRDQTKAAGAAFFLKQMEIYGRVVHMPELDGRQWVEYPK